MNALRLPLSLFAALAVLAGCGGSQPLTGAPGAVQSGVVAQHAGPGTSWMLPEASGEDLLYVTNYSVVTVYTYPQGKLVGTLKGFNSASGACVDAAGDVFVANFKPLAVYEYAHGGTKRIATYKGVGTYSCAVDPVSGDLAVTGATQTVFIFQEGKSKARVLRDRKTEFFQSCVYDDKGNLFLDGYRNNKGKPALTELPKGTNKFVEMEIDAPIYGEGQLQWDGSYLTALAYVPPKARVNKPEIFQLAIKGTRAIKVGATPLNKPAYFVPGYVTSSQVPCAHKCGEVGRMQRAMGLLF